jgi:hypothetical protein
MPRWKKKYSSEPPNKKWIPKYGFGMDNKNMSKEQLLKELENSNKRILEAVEILEEIDNEQEKDNPTRAKLQELKKKQLQYENIGEFLETLHTPPLKKDNKVRHSSYFEKPYDNSERGHEEYGPESKKSMLPFLEKLDSTGGHNLDVLDTTQDTPPYNTLTLEECDPYITYYDSYIDTFKQFLKLLMTTPLKIERLRKIIFDLKNDGKMSDGIPLKYYKNGSEVYPSVKPIIEEVIRSENYAYKPKSIFSKFLGKGGRRTAHKHRKQCNIRKTRKHRR